MAEICARCGRDLDTLGEYKDFVHLTPKGYPCLPSAVRDQDVRILVDRSQMFETYSLKEEIAEWERKHRPFPPRSGSVSKPWLMRPDDPWLVFGGRQFSDEYVESWKAEQAYKDALRTRIRQTGYRGFRLVAAEHSWI